MQTKFTLRYHYMVHKIAKIYTHWGREIGMFSSLLVRISVDKTHFEKLLNIIY